MKNAHKGTMAKDVQRYAVATVLETYLSVIMSLVHVTWVVIQDIRAIYAQTVMLVEQDFQPVLQKFMVYIK
ncbi:hypothetical protein RRG08_064913 [Elysia crispata]|uniref:Uncharacterized protein n=1 Tax=Elysia crispata TaxID=231223 RepID=A0AAE1CP66_9GAST|nr:hypothetical protein RRG08_064913 [Elysia crispata]